MIFFTFYMDSWRVIIFSAFNYDTVFYLIILSINLYIIFLSIMYVDGIIWYISVDRRHIRRIRIRYSSVCDQWIAWIILRTDFAFGATIRFPIMLIVFGTC